MLHKDEIKVGTQIKSTMYGNGTVVEIYDLTEPLFFYPYMVKFEVARAGDLTYSSIIPFDVEGFNVKQHGNTPDGVFY
jgi:hypothetical protein